MEAGPGESRRSLGAPSAIGTPAAGQDALVDEVRRVQRAGAVEGGGPLRRLLPAAGTGRTVLPPE